MPAMSRPMAPATNLSAATPISIGGLPGSPKPEEKEKKGQDDLPADYAATLKRKLINDTSASVKSLAERHGRNADWSVPAFRSGQSVGGSPCSCATCRR